MLYIALLGTLVSMTVASTLTICLLGWVVWNICRFRAMTRRLYMDIDELVKTLGETDVPSDGTSPTGRESTTAACEDKRERLAAIVAGGLGERFLGRVLSIEQVEKLPACQVEKLHTRYEIYLGASLSKDIGHSIVQMLSDLAAHIRKQIDPIALAADLEANPIIAHELCVYSGGLYSRFGRLLAPLSVLLTTIKHCRFGEMTEDGGTSGDTGEGEKPGEGCSGPTVG